MTGLDDDVDDRDTVLDSLALVAACFQEDADAARVILDHCDLWPVAAVTACLVGSLIRDFALVVDEPADAVLAEVRQRQKAHFGLD